MIQKRNPALLLSHVRTSYSWSYRTITGRSSDFSIHICFCLPGIYQWRLLTMLIIYNQPISQNRLLYYSDEFVWDSHPFPFSPDIKIWHLLCSIFIWRSQSISYFINWYNSSFLFPNVSWFSFPIWKYRTGISQEEMPPLFVSFPLHLNYLIQNAD